MKLGQLGTCPSTIVVKYTRCTSSESSTVIQRGYQLKLFVLVFLVLNFNYKDHRNKQTWCRASWKEREFRFVKDEELKTTEPQKPIEAQTTRLS